MTTVEYAGNAVIAILYVTEVIVCWRRADAYFPLWDTVVSWIMLAGNTLSSLIWAPLAFGMYALAWQIAPTKISSSTWWTFILLFIVDDFVHYWGHRCEHVLRPFWVSHFTHHSSHEFNLTVAFRTSWTGGLLLWLFRMPLALLGFEPGAIVSVALLGALLQVPAHTRYFRSLGFLEYVLVTPSSHRVHHGRNPEYVNKNFGGVLIVWDRLFGTFQPERAPVNFGTISIYSGSLNPLLLAFGEWYRMACDVWQSKTWTDRLNHIWRVPQVAVGPPESPRK